MMKRILSVLLASGVLSGAALSGALTDIKSVSGQSISTTDGVVTLSRQLHGAGNTDNWRILDLNGDERLDVTDLCLLKRSLLTQEEAVVTLEAEDAVLGGGNRVAEDLDASGGKAVGTFSSEKDTIEFTLDIPEGGSYELVLRSKGIGGGKENYVTVDGQQVGLFSSAADEYSEYSLKSILLTEGKHNIGVTNSWGWIWLDKLTVKRDEAISDSAYEVGGSLIDGNATSETQALYDYLREGYGKRVLSGQVCNDGLDGDEIKAIYEVTGKYPAMVGLDMMDLTSSRTALGARSNAIETAIAYHQSGGIVTFCWHWNAPSKYLKDGTDENGNPRWWGGFYTANSDFDIAAVMNGEDVAGKALIDADIKEIAAQLNRLQDEGIPVLWRPLHEASGGWFWWGAKGAEAYKKLWVYLYEQLTDVYECHNLIWVWNGQSADWYPGDGYADIIGMDIYADAHNYTAHTPKFVEMLDYPESNKMLALSENGTLFNIDNAVAGNSLWSWFCTWCGEFVIENGKYTEKYTEAEILRETYLSEYVITLDELPKPAK